MPEIGEIVKGIEAGYNKSGNKFIWTMCPDCKKERWVMIWKGKPKNYRCKSCASIGKNNNCWRGGKRHIRGYVQIWLNSKDPFHKMTGGKGNYVYEHRLVMAKHLERCLKSWEIVHHKNNIKTDNRLDNLEIVKSGDHMNFHDQFRLFEKKIKSLEEEIYGLKKELILCRQK